jgi:hypothetical protein
MIFIEAKINKSIMSEKIQKINSAMSSKVLAQSSLKATHGNTGKFLIKESMRQIDTIMADLLHVFVYKTQGINIDADEILN